MLRNIPWGFKELDDVIEYEDDDDLAEAAGLVKAGKNEDQIEEYIGTDKQWSKYYELLKEKNEI